MSIFDPHISSAHRKSSKQKIEYRDEREIRTFVPDTCASSSSLPYPETTLKRSKSSTQNSTHSARIKMDIPKISREESYYRLNQKLRGKMTTGSESGNE